MKYLITGVTGTLGQAVTKLILKDQSNEIIGVSRDEQKQRLLVPHDRLTLRLGDIRDADRLLELSRGVDLIFHFAALKCVDTLEDNVEECIKTNILGTQNIVHSQRINNIPRVVLSATDKGAYPINVYGNTKAISEKLVLQNKNNVVCRYGNVIGSRGSVVPMFVKSLLKERTVYITKKMMTRFLITIDDAAKFVFDESQSMYGGLRTPEMRSARMEDVAESVATILGISKFNYVVTGMRPGEKIHECLRTEQEGSACYSDQELMTKKELISLLKPLVEAL